MTQAEILTLVQHGGLTAVLGYAVWVLWQRLILVEQKLDDCLSSKNQVDKMAGLDKT